MQSPAARATGAARLAGFAAGVMYKGQDGRLYGYSLLLLFLVLMAGNDVF
jgi:hypothetical protein